MDNAIRFDRSSMVSNGVGAWSLNQESVDLNAYLAYEYRLLKELAIMPDMNLWNRTGRHLLQITSLMLRKDSSMTEN